MLLVSHVHWSVKEPALHSYRLNVNIEAVLSPAAVLSVFNALIILLVLCSVVCL